MMFTTKVNEPYHSVKSSFVSRDKDLINYLTPPMCELIHYKGLRRGAILRYLIFDKLTTFKVVTYSTKDNELYYHDILKEGRPLGIKFWSHRHKIKDIGKKSLIQDEIIFSTSNTKMDFILNPLVAGYFLLRKIKYKIFFFTKAFNWRIK